MTTHRTFVVLLAVALVATDPRRAWSAITAQGGIGFVAVTGATEGDVLVLESPRHREIARGTADRFGSLLFRDLTPGDGYQVRTAGGDAVAANVSTLEDRPPPAFYAGQTLREGFQYIAARDGTLLATMVRPPTGRTLADGPFPTVVEYSGYAAADPDNPQPFTLIAGILGFATVAVNMRGSGCSGSVLDLFDLPTTADGYDVVETVAAQSWVQGGKVGMIGISFPGISQLFVAGARPPHLAAVAPLSVIADIYRAPGFPGGIFNTGFARSWLQDRKDDAAPAPEGGQAYARKRVNAGDETCRANQRLRLQTLDPGRVHAVASLLRARPDGRPVPDQLAGDIAVPVFLASAWHDEQTGGDFASMLGRLPKRDDVKITLTNGVHSSSSRSRDPLELVAFLDLYVAGRVPDPSRIATVVPILYQTILGAGSPAPPLPIDRFDGITSYEQAKRMFEADPHVRVLMENGAGSTTPGLPAPTFELGFTRWPPPPAHPTRWYFGAGGTLARSRPGAHTAGADGYRPDPTVRPAQTLPGQGQEQSWEVLPAYDWRPLVDGTAPARDLPLERDVTIAGPSSVDLWLRSSAADTDLQVTLTEIRPDGLEVYVQNGWLRASHRRLDRRRSTVLEPRPTHLERHAAPLPAGEFARFGSAVRGRARLPPRVAHPGEHRGPGRRSHALGLRHNRDPRRDPERGRLHRGAAVARRAAGDPRRRGATRPAALPQAARPAVPQLRARGKRRVTLAASRHPARRASRTSRSARARDRVGVVLDPERNRHEVGRARRGQRLDLRAHGVGAHPRSRRPPGLRHLRGRAWRDTTAGTRRAQLAGRRGPCRIDLRRHRDRQADDHARRGSAGLRRRLANARDRVLADRLRARHPGDRSLGLAAGEGEHARRERGEQDGARGRAGHRHLRGHAVLVAHVPDTAGADERGEHGDVFTHVAERLGEREAEHPLDHHLVREADAEREAPLARGLRRHRRLRHRHRVAGERGHDRRAELDSRRLTPADRRRHDRVDAEDVREPAAREAVRFGALHLRDEPVQVRGRARDVTDPDPNAHRHRTVVTWNDGPSPLPAERQPGSQAPDPAQTAPGTTCPNCPPVQ
ncbi:MAG: CocE/NonD family hydrolase [Candidatus Binatia bacterium]